MKRAITKKSFVVLILAVILSGILGSVFTRPFVYNTTYLYSDFTSQMNVDVSENGKTLSTLNFDPQTEMVFRYNVYISDVIVRLDEAQPSDWEFEIYVANKNGDFTEEQRQSYQVAAGQKEVNVPLNSMVQKIRLDWGNNADVTYKLDGIRFAGLTNTEIGGAYVLLFLMLVLLFQAVYYVWINRKENEIGKSVSILFVAITSFVTTLVWILRLSQGTNVLKELFVGPRNILGVSMTFTTLNFIFVFLPLTVVAYYLLKTNFRNIFLVIVSIYFYAACEPVMVWLLLLSVFVNYVLGLLLAKEWKSMVVERLFLIIMLAWNFGLLFYYKYFIFTLETVNHASGADFIIPTIIQPLGISFFTFRTVSFCLDVYWKTVPVQYNFINVALYICFFPQISMGPISKYNDFSAQLNERKFDLDLFLNGVRRIIIGWGKKLLIANNIGTTVDVIFKMSGGERTIALAWIGILGYLIQLYFDFSGYSDVAVGVGQLFGFKTPENFNYPFVSKSVVEYWTRWHATLGTWLKNYIYTPIFRACQDKNIAIASCNILALIGVWLFAGVWHGAGWNYLCYGIYYCIFIILERVVSDHKKKKRKRLKLKKQPETTGQKVRAHIYFFIVLIFGQLLFRCADLPAFGDYVLSLFGLNGNQVWDTQTHFYFRQSIILLVIGWIFSFPVVNVVKEKLEKSKVGALMLNIVTPVMYTLLLVVSIAFAMTDTYQSFIYFQF